MSERPGRQDGDYTPEAAPAREALTQLASFGYRDGVLDHESVRKVAVLGGICPPVHFSIPFVPWVKWPLSLFEQGETRTREGTSWITVQIGRQIPASDLSSNDQNPCWRETPKLRKSRDGWHIEEESIQTDSHTVEPDGREGRTQRDGDGCSASDEGHGFRPSGGIGQVQ